MIQKLIPLIYFYLLSLIGMVLLIIGVFHSIHFIAGISVYERYPLEYGGAERCLIQPAPVSEKETDAAFSSEQARKECLDGLEEERMRTKAKDLEESIAFTVVGLLVFSSHFYLARKTRREK